MTRIYYKDAHGALIVFDSSRKETFNGALRWKTDLDNKINLVSGNSIPTVLAASKCDLASTSVLHDRQLDEYCKEHKFLAAFRTSAKENFGLDEAFKFLVEKVSFAWPLHSFYFHLNCERSTSISGQIAPGFILYNTNCQWSYLKKCFTYFFD